MQLNRPDHVDFSGPEWMALEEWLKLELETTLSRLSNWNAPDTEVRQLQGRASVLKQMLGFRTQSAAFGPQR